MISWRYLLRSGRLLLPMLVMTVLAAANGPDSRAAMRAVLRGTQWQNAPRVAQQSSITFRGNLARTGVYQVSGVPAAAGVLWEHRLPRNATYAAPVVFGDLVYVLGEDLDLHALERGSGEERWKIDAGISHSAPEVLDGVLYFGGGPSFHAMDARTGETRWEFSTATNVSTAPVLSAGVAYFATEAGVIHAVELASGDEQWHLDTADHIIATPALAGGLLYFAGLDLDNMGGVLRAIDPATGEVRWDETRGAYFNAPAVAGGIVYAASGDNHLYALDARTGAQRWEFESAGGWGMSAVAVADGVVYAGSSDAGGDFPDPSTVDKYLYALDAQTGAELWKYETDSFAGDPTIAAGVLYFGEQNYNRRRIATGFHALDARSGERLWRQELASMPVAHTPADGAIYVVTLNGTIYALGPQQAAPQEPPAAIPGSGSRLFPETGKTVRGLFLDYWNGNGGLAQQGFPISEVLGEVSELDGKPYTVQYFERAVFEYHPENEAPFNVLLSQLGTFRYRELYPDGAPDQQPNVTAGSRLFVETGKRAGGRFLEYWQANGGLAQQGFPISDEFMERSELDGRTYRVQYFERAVFELHPENDPPFDVLLSQLGTFRYRELYGAP